MLVRFYPAQGGSEAGGIFLHFRDTLKYWVGFCMSGYTDFPTEHEVPSAKEKVWRVTLTRTSGIRIVLQCNEKELLNVLLSNSTCSGYSTWRKFWNRDVERIEFDSSSDTASDFYRPQGN